MRDITLDTYQTSFRLYTIEEDPNRNFIIYGPSTCDVAKFVQGAVEGFGKGVCATRDLESSDEPPVGEEGDEDHPGAGDGHHRPQHRANRYDNGAHRRCSNLTLLLHLSN